MENKSVLLYSLSTCGHCRSAKKLLSQNEIEYDYVDVDQLTGDERKTMIEKVKSLNPRCSFPTIVIGDQVIVGFKEDQIRQALDL